jgi:hypothetical protein
MKYSFCEELERVFKEISKYHTKILLDFNAKVGKEDFLKSPIVKEDFRRK